MEYLDTEVINMANEICIKKYGKTYCWNPDTKIIEEIIRRPVDSNNCPRAVMYELLKLIGEHNRTEKNRENTP